MASIHGQIEQYVNSGASVPPEVAVAARNIVDGGLLADMTAYSPEMTTEQRQELLETIDVADRLRLASAFLAKQIEVLELKGRSSPRSSPRWTRPSASTSCASR
jgi:ATP-dependent Lon protease